MANKIKRKNIPVPPNVFFVRPGARYLVTRNLFSLLHEWRADRSLLFLFCLGLLLMAISIPTLHRELLLLTSPTTTVRAEIIHRETRTCRSKNSSYTCYYLTYRYFQGDSRYDDERRDDHKRVGEFYTVTYLDSNPRIHHVGGKHLVLDEAAWPLVMGLALIFAALYACLDVWLEYRPYDLEGEWAYGRLSSVKGERVRRSKSSEYKLSVRYSYTDPFNLTQEIGGQVETRNDLSNSRLPKPGTPVLVLVKPISEARAL